MPLLLNVLRNANGTEHKKLRWKAMECAGLIGRSSLPISFTPFAHTDAAIAVGRDVFRADSAEFVELLMQIQSMLLFFYPCLLSKNSCVLQNKDSPIDPGDTMLNHYLIATWAKVCQALGPDFEPYLPVVMPSLLRTANAKADVSIWGKICSFRDDVLYVC